MRLIKLIPITVLVMLAVNVSAQEADTTTTLFDYELVPTVNPVSGTDTVYKAYFLIDILELQKYKKLVVVADDKEKILSLKPEDVASDARFEIVGNNYRINIEDWSGSLNWTVTGKLHDDSEKKLANKKEKDKVKHIVVKKTKTRDLQISTDNTIEEKIQQD